MKASQRRRARDYLFALHQGRCAYCHVQTEPARDGPARHPWHATIDHVIPRSKGGPNDRSNLVLACFACNQSRGDTL